DAVRSIVLIDDAGSVAAGKALDITQAGPIEGFATQLRGAADLSHAAGASIVVIADRAATRADWQGDEGLHLLERVMGVARHSAFVCAGAAQRALVDRGVRELPLPRGRLFGTAPDALAAGARALVALALDCSPRAVAMTVVGLPPAHIVIPWE